MDGGHKPLYVRYNADSGEPLPELSGSLRGEDLTQQFGNQWATFDFKYDWQNDEKLQEVLAQNEIDINSFSFDEREAFSDPDITKNPLFTDVWAKYASDVDSVGQPVYMSEREMQRKVRFTARKVRGQPESLLTDAEDLSGLAALRPYMSPKDYQALSTATFGNEPWLSAYTQVDPESGEVKPKYMSPEAIERVRKTVDMLAASGETFTFEPDTNPGQVRIKFANGMTMRVIDPANESFACNHVYHQGSYMHYQVQGGSGPGYAYDKVTPEMSVDLVRFARGEAVKRRKDDTFDLAAHVGDVGNSRLSDVLGVPGVVRTRDAYSSDPTRRGAGIQRQTAYTNTNGTNLNVLVDVLPLGQSPASEQPSPDKALVITCDYTNRSASHMTFEDAWYEDRVDGKKEEKFSSGALRAEKYLRESIDKAWAGFDREVNVDSIIEEAAAVRARIEAGEEVDDAVYSKLSSNPDVAIIQGKYWDILTGRSDMLLKPAFDVDMHDVESEDEESSEVEAFSDVTLNRVYDENMTPEEMVRAHSNDLKRYLIGRFDPELQIDPSNPSEDNLVSLRFNPNMVCRYMSGSTGFSSENKNIIAACKRLGLGVDELKYVSMAGSGSSEEFQRDVARDKLVTFDEASKQNIFTGDFGSPVKNEFMKSMGDSILEALQTNGCRVNPDDIMIDKNGIVHYSATRIISKPGAINRTGRAKEAAEASYLKFNGEIGKIYAPDEKGVVKTSRFIGVPGYQARVEPNKPGENKPYEERIVLTSYEQAMKDAIRSHIRQDLTTRGALVEGHQVVNKRLDGSTNIFVSPLVAGESFSVDNVLRNFVDIRFPLDFDDDKAVQARGLDLATRDAIIAASRQKCKFSKEFLEGSNEAPVFSALNGTNGERRDVLNDNCMDALTLSGYRNVALLEAPGDGMFDPFATGNAGAQGVRYLVDGAKVGPDGHVIPSENKDRNSREARCAMVNYLRDAGRYPDFDSPDRMNMDINSIMHCHRVTKPVGFAQMDVGMYTLEDGPVVSKKFAEENFVPDHHTGEPRALGRGDKIGSHGNKGVISAVIDPDMPEADARKQGIWPLVQLFKANPELDVVMSSYSGPARFNAGLAVEAINSNPTDLVNPISGKVHEKSIGYVSMIVMEQTADAKTHHDVDAGDGRSYGAQMLWALSAKDCPEIIKTAFRTNVKASSNMRELSMVLGLDVDPTGSFSMGYKPHPGEVRNVFELPDVKIEEWQNSINNPYLTDEERKQIPRTKRGTPAPENVLINGVLKPVKMNSRPKLMCTTDTLSDLDAQFDEWLTQHGGFMEIPFPLDFKTKGWMQKAQSELVRQNDDEGLMRLAELKESGAGSTEVYDPEKFGREGGAHTTNVLWTSHRGSLEDKQDIVHDPKATVGADVGRPTYVLPVMSSYLRAGQELGDGELKAHDWTKHYKTIFNMSREYVKQQASIDFLMAHREELMPQYEVAAQAYRNDLAKTNPELASKVTAESMYEEQIQSCYNEMETCKNKAQSSYNKIASEVEYRKFSGKHNIFRAGIMANKQPHSCTAVWSADPSLGVDEMGMSGAMMKSLGLEEGDYCLVHRDPVLYGSAIRYMKVKRDDRLVGVSVHPAGVPGGMQGDFDGDTVGPRAFDKKDEAARKEAMAKLSVKANLLNTYSDPKTFSDGTKGYPLFIATNQDVMTGMSDGKDANGVPLKQKLEMIEMEVNKNEQAYAEKEAALAQKLDEIAKRSSELRDRMDESDAVSGKKGVYGEDIIKERLEIIELRKSMVAEREDLAKAYVTLDEQRTKSIGDINTFLADCAEASFGKNVMSYASKTANIMCNETIVKSGAKGKPAGVDLLAGNMGVSYERDEDGDIIPETIKEYDVNITSREHLSRQLLAKNIQQQHTGTAGENTITHESCFMNLAPEAASGLGGAVTDATLQIKHDAVKGIRFEMLMTTVTKDMAAGLRLVPSKRNVITYDPEAIVKDSEGKPIIDPATNEPKKGAFVGQMMDTWMRHMTWKTPPPDSKAKGRFVTHQATCSEYIEQLEGLYNSKAGFDVGVKHEYIETIASVLSAPSLDGTCLNMKTEFKPKYSSYLQQCAYTVTPDSLYKMSFDMMGGGTGLYEMPKRSVELFKNGVQTPSGSVVGKMNNMNVHIADGCSVRRNIEMRDRALAKCKTPEERAQTLERVSKNYIPVVRQDTVVDGKANVAKAKISSELTASLPKSKEVQNDMPAFDAESVFAEFTQSVNDFGNIAMEQPAEKLAVSSTRSAEQLAAKTPEVSAPKASPAPAPKATSAPAPAPGSINLSVDPSGPVLTARSPRSDYSKPQSGCDKSLGGLDLQGGNPTGNPNKGIGE